MSNPNQKGGATAAPPETVEQAALRFLNEKKSQLVSGAPYHYSEPLNRFASWLLLWDITQPDQITPQILTAWTSAERRKFPNPGTIRNKLGAVGAFLKWCFVEKLISENIGDNSPPRLIDSANLPPEIKKAITDFTGRKHGRRLAANTLSRYSQVLTHFAIWLAGQPGVTTLADISPEMLAAWESTRAEEPTTARIEIHSVRIFLRWCFGKGLMAEGIIPKTRRRPKAPVVKPANSGQLAPVIPEEMEVAIVDFLNEKRSQGLSKTSVGRYNPAPLTKQTDNEMGKYGYILTRFAVWLASQEITQPDQITRRIVIQWAAVKTEGRAPATARTSIQIIRSFLKWAFETKLIADDLAAGIKAPKIKLRIQRTLNAAEVQKLLDACDHNDLGIRNRAIVALMVDSGLRNSEFCSLKITDLFFQDDPEEGSHYVTVIGKGGNEGRAYFSDATLYPLRKWLEVRLRLQFNPGASPPQSLFLAIGGDKPGQPLTRHGLRQVLSELGQRAGVAGVSPHGLRRTFATLMVSSGAPSRTVQAAGRWSDLTMVERYTQALETSKAYGEFSPMGNVIRKAAGRLKVRGIAL